MRPLLGGTIILLAVSTFGTALAAQGSPGKPPGGGEDAAVNNLSFPVAFTGDPAATIPSDVGQGLYRLEGFYYLWDGASAPCDPLTCNFDPGVTLSRIYVQKDPLNDWQAQWRSNLGTVGISHIDVGDNLESVPWRTTSVVRVEFVPFSVDPTLLGFDMAYVSGQGIDEVWGALASDASTPVARTGFPGYATVNSSCAALSLTKLELASGSIDVEPDPPTLSTPAYQWDGSTHLWKRTADGSAVAQTVKIEPFSAEINVKGRMIYGYNWMLKRLVMNPSVSKDGWWRLTFYATCAISPFDFSATTQKFDPTAVEEPEEGEEPSAGTYPRVPIVRPDEELTFIDIYIQASSSSGGKGGRPGR